MVGRLSCYVAGEPAPCDRCEICGEETNLCSDEPAIEVDGLIFCSAACEAIGIVEDDVATTEAA